MATTDSMQSRVQRSVYHAIRLKVVELGYLPDIFFYPNTVEGDELYKAAVDAIIADKGFAIEVFGQSSARAKLYKNCPRIVVFMSRVYDGEIGAPAKLLEKQIDGNYKSGLIPTLASNMVFSIHLLSNKTNQDVLLNSIISNVFGQRTFIKFYDEPDNQFFMVHTSYNDLEDPQENIIERAYTYTAKDIYVGDTVDTGIIGSIKEITLDTKLSEPESDKLTIKINP